MHEKVHAGDGSDFNNIFIKNASCATRIHNKVLKRSLIVKFILTRAVDCQSAVFDG